MNLNKFAKTLRKQSTDTEIFLWQHLKAKRLGGFKFRRQEPIGRYIVDFVCHEKGIVVECDGHQHIDSIKDQERDRCFSSQGYQVLRFWDNDVLQNINGVLEIILKTCRASPSP